MKSNIVPDASSADQDLENRPSPIARLGRKVLLASLARIDSGELTLIDGDQVLRFGRRDATCPLAATLTVANPRFYGLAAFSGTVGVGEAYVQGDWRCDNLTALVRIVLCNRSVLESVDSGLARAAQPLLRIFHWLQNNTRRGSARNISAHYDLGNDFYALMLDETMAYSCGIFARPEATLAEASRAKFEAACRKLELQPDDHLLEIGSGWGGLAIHAAQQYGCRVTTTTISREQHRFVVERIRQLGLDLRIEVLLQDYRDLKGQYDKLVSIEMIEAVGANFLDTYLRKCAALLKDQGAMLLQSITLQDQFYERALRTVDFIQRFVFPGSFIPSLNAIGSSLRRVTDLKVFHLEDIGPHYGRTLALWRDNFHARLADVRRLGFQERFIRLWEFYLSYCEAGFEERRLGDVQMLLTKPRYRGMAGVAG
jgi:cyclopropane-fatty-acyl-phospholipid synthase